MSEAKTAGTTPGRSDRVSLEFAGEFHHAYPGDVLTVGREGTLAIDDNPFLHRHFLRISRSENLWWLANVGSRLSATVTDGWDPLESTCRHASLSIL